MDAALTKKSRHSHQKGLTILEEKNMVKSKGALLLALLAVPVLAAAGTNDLGVNRRQSNQQARIQQGVKSGELTRAETRRLQAEQRHIRREEARYKADGHLSAAERADLQRDLNKASRDIYHQKHDAQQRPPVAVRDPGVNARQRNQQGLIAQGVRSGELTKEEAKGLAQEQRSIRQEERQYKADGVLTKDERKDLHQDLNAASRNIYNEKHDSDTRN
jgi:polyhydroxyalkanoate synthesis regulator phasin